MHYPGKGAAEWAHSGHGRDGSWAEVGSAVRTTGTGTIHAVVRQSREYQAEDIPRTVAVDKSPEGAAVRSHPVEAVADTRLEADNLLPLLPEAQVEAGSCHRSAAEDTVAVGADRNCRTVQGSMTLS